MGRVRGAPHPVLLELLYGPALAEDRRTVLPYLLRIDAAHVLMLARTGIIDRAIAAQLLALNQELAEASGRGEAFGGAAESHRGLYWLYEEHCIRRLGAEVGGAAHVARSRNDINAAVTRLRARDELLSLLESLGQLLDATAAVAVAHRGTVMSCFTHLQPAQPSTFGHYLAGIGGELARSGLWLAGTFEVVNRSPMGAAAGAGTSFPIDREQVATRLGFSGVIENSLDAVASRDYLVQILAAAAMAGSTLTRLSGDLQLWASHAYSFLGWPDELVSTSSIMPQKRNAFVLETIRGQAIQPAAALSATLLALKSTPFSNGVEVSAEATALAWPGLAGARKAIRLMTLLLDGMEVHPERMRSFLAGAETTMTALADHLVARHGLAFRTSHDAIGALLRELPAGAAEDPETLSQRLEEVLAATMLHPPRLDRAEIAAALDPCRCMASALHGGGPAPAAVEGQLASLAEVSASLRERTAGWRRNLAAADRGLAEEVAGAVSAAAG